MTLYPPQRPLPTRSQAAGGRLSRLALHAHLISSPGPKGNLTPRRTPRKFYAAVPVYTIWISPNIPLRPSRASPLSSVLPVGSIARGGPGTSRIIRGRHAGPGTHSIGMRE